MATTKAKAKPGRKCIGTEPMVVASGRLSKEMHAKYLKLGGSAWLQVAVKEAKVLRVRK